MGLPKLIFYTSDPMDFSHEMTWISEIFEKTDQMQDEHIQKRCAAMTEERKGVSEENLADYDDYISDEYYFLEKQLQIIRRSFYLIVYAQFEHNLKNLCEDLYRNEKVEKKPSTEDIRDVGHCCRYLNDNMGMEKKDYKDSFKFMYDARPVRNFIAHHDSRLDKRDKDYDAAKLFINKNDNINVDSGDIILEKEFILKLINDASKSFFELYDILKIRE